jgi:hypothetical protein
VRVVPSASPPAIQSTPAARNQTRIRHARKRSIVPAAAVAKVRNVCRPTWMATYDEANSSPWSPNASGIATAISRLASISAISTPRTTLESGSSSLVTQVV